MWDIAKYFHVPTFLTTMGAGMGFGDTQNNQDNATQIHLNELKQLKQLVQGQQYHRVRDAIAQQETNRLHLDQGQQGHEGFTSSTSSKSAKSATTATPDIPTNLPPIVQQKLKELEQIHDTYTAQIEHVAELEALYYQGLHEYTVRMKLPISGKNIKIGETIYYITPFGYARKYASDSVWTNRHSSCGGEPLVQDTSIDRLGVLMGPDMTESTQCGFEGKVVQYDKKTAYVKMNGEVLLYVGLTPQDVADCPSDDIVQVDETTWNMLMSDKSGDMTKDTKCLMEALDITTPDGHNVKDQLKKARIAIAKSSEEINDLLTNVIHVQLKNLKEYDDNQKTQFEEYVRKMNKSMTTYAQQQNANRATNKDETLSAMDETMRIIHRQSYYKYIVYVVGTVIGLFVLYMIWGALSTVVSGIGSGLGLMNANNPINANKGKVARGAPRQSVLKREAEGSSVFGGVGLGNLGSMGRSFMNSMTPGASASASPSTPARSIRPARSARPISTVRSTQPSRTRTLA